MTSSPHLRRLALTALALAAGLAGCFHTQNQHRSVSVLDYLFPDGATDHAPSELTLALPARVGVAFVPREQNAQRLATWRGEPSERFGSDVEDFNENVRRALLERVADAFRDRPEIGSIQVLPTHLLNPGGGFAEVETLASVYDLDMVALVSYDQLHFGRETAGAVTYWTLVGAFVWEGDETETYTVLDTSVFDVRSKNLLLTALGTSAQEERSAPIDTKRVVRRATKTGFEAAATALIDDLDGQLELLASNVKAGTLHGPGSTPVTVEVRPGDHGVASFGWLELTLAGLLLLAASRLR